MALSIGELVGYLSFDDSGVQKGTASAERAHSDMVAGIVADGRRVDALTYSPKLDADKTAIEAAIRAVLADLDRLRSQTASVEVTAEIAQAEQRLDGLQSDLARVDAARANVTVDADTAGAGRNLSELETAARRVDGQDVDVQVTADTAAAEREVRGLGDTMKSIGVAGAAALGGALVSFGPDVLQIGAQLEQVAQKSKIVFGDSQGAVQAWADASATSMGLTSTAAVGLATNMGDLLIPMGFGRDQAATMATEIVGLSGALSEWSGGTKSAAEVAEIMTAAMLGETDGLQALGISLSAAEIDAELAAKGQDKLTGAALAQAEAQAVQNLVMAKSGDAQTAFANGADGSLRSQAALNAKLAEGKEALITGLFPAFQAVVDFVVGTFIPGMQAVAWFVSDNSTAFGIAAGIITAVFLPAIIAAGVQSTISAGKQVLAWALSSGAAVASVVTTVGAVARQIAAWVLLGAQSLLQAARVAAAWVVAMGPIGWVIAAVVGLVALIIANWDTVSAWTSKAWGAVVGFITDAWNNIISFITGAIASVVGFISDGWNNATRMAGDAWSNIVNAVRNGANNVLTFVRGLPGQILSALGNLGNLLFSAGRDIVTGLWNGIVGMGSWLMGQITGWIRRVVPGPILSFLGIASPSKFMKNEVGRWIPEGLADGIIGNAKVAGDAARDMAMQTAAGAQRALGSDGAALQFGVGGMAVTGRAGGAPVTESAATVDRSVTVQINNPLPESGSDSINRRARTLALLGSD